MPACSTDRELATPIAIGLINLVCAIYLLARFMAWLLIVLNDKENFHGSKVPMFFLLKKN